MLRRNSVYKKSVFIGSEWKKEEIREKKEKN